MKIELHRIPSEGLSLYEEIDPAKLDLEIENVNFRQPIKLTAEVFRIYNVVKADLVIEASIYGNCSRCLDEYSFEFRKKLTLNYPVSKSDLVIDLDSEVREELIVNYPLKPLCRQDCKGMCLKCGKNLNIEKCDCEKHKA